MEEYIFLELHMEELVSSLALHIPLQLMCCNVLLSYVPHFRGHASHIPSESRSYSRPTS